MVKQWATLCIVILVWVVPAALAQDALVISPELEMHMNAIEDYTSELRELEQLEPLVREFPTRQEVIDYLQATFDTDLPAEVAEREVQFYIAFDLLPEDTGLREIYLELLSSQVAGFYDPETKEMNVVLIVDETPGDKLPLMEQIVYSHEFAHALQDQHFGLRELGFDAELALSEPDRLLAIQALIEGDATVVMTLYTQAVAADNPLAALQLLAQGFQAGNLFLPADTPSILTQELLFPYNTGSEFVLALFRDGGWERVNQAYTELPQSTEQILHPERYLRGDVPQDMTLEPADDVLGSDWTLLLDRTMGEFYLREYLATQLTRQQARMAAEGWGGDRYHIYRNEATGELAWVLRLDWDTTADAAEFAGEYESFGSTRFEDGDYNAPCWSDADDALCFISDEEGSLLVLASTREMALALLESQDLPIPAGG
jgi:hypothetical protein